MVASPPTNSMRASSGQSERSENISYTIYRQYQYLYGKREGWLDYLPAQIFAECGAKRLRDIHDTLHGLATELINGGLDTVQHSKSSERSRKCSDVDCECSSWVLLWVMLCVRRFMGARLLVLGCLNRVSV
jgi:hypothetical protein